MADLVNVAPGQCRLQVDSTSQISLQRFQGKFIPLKIGGNWEAKIIPLAGVTLANTGLTQATAYNVYAFDSGGTLTLEAVTTAHAVDADTGVEIKSGDASRTLVGKVFMDTGTPGLFVDSVIKRWCLNWFNRSDRSLENGFSADRTTTSTTFVEINTEIRLQFLAWADEAVVAGGEGAEHNNAAGNAVGTALGFDSATVVAGTGATHGATTWQPWALFAVKFVTEGSHFITLLGAVSGGTATWAAADAIGTGPMKSRIWAKIRG